MNVEAAWDSEAQVWTVMHSEVVGLVAEASTAEDLLVKLQNLIPELLAANGLDAEQPAAVELTLHSRI